MKFNYQARTKTGELKVGQIEATSYETALDILQRYGYFVTFLEQEKKKSLLSKDIKFLGGIKKRDIVIFTRQLSILLLSQTPPVEALHTLSIQSSNPDLSNRILKIASDVEGGMSFSKALLNHPKIFSSFYVNMVKSGEASGDLPRTLVTLADHMEHEYDLIAKVRGAAVYPIFVLCFIIVLAVLMILFVFPQLEKVFSETGAELPALTTFMLNFAKFLRRRGIFLLVFLAVGIFFLIRYLKSATGRQVFDSFILRLPAFGDFMKKIYLSRFSENLSTLIQGGLPIAQALEISGRVVGNSVYQKVIFAARDGVRRGESISSVFKKAPSTISPLAYQMIFVGERTGQLDQTLVKISSFYKKEVDLEIDKFISLLEPILIILLGIGVMFIILSVILPIYQMGLGTS